MDWLLGHDNGGYDRAILARDSRFGGISAGVGTSYSSSVSYAEVSKWTHVVATFSKANGVATIYKNGGISAGGVEQTVSIVSDSGSTYSQIGLNGLQHYGGHQFVGCIGQVQITNRVVEPSEVRSLYTEFDAVVNRDSRVLLQHTEAFSVTRSKELGRINMHNDMHFEFDVRTDSFPSSWASVFHCGAENTVRMPGIWTHPDSDDEGKTFTGFHISFSTINKWNPWMNPGPVLEAGGNYHVEIDVTQSLLSV